MRTNRWAVALVMLAGCGGPSPDREGEQWTHKELLEHLNGQGLKLRAVPGSPAGPFGVYQDWVPDDAPLSWRPQAAAGRNQPGWDTPFVRVFLRPTAQDARDGAGPRGRGFAWGRFRFAGELGTEGERRLFDQVRSALGVR